mmetsp:Transcript_7694/g.12976  ORF Transcript_7694/g.12976 Transcript_7694/m.12976 type:complete len:249 (-) Transcript_7694:247-993(-)
MMSDGLITSSSRSKRKAEDNGGAPNDEEISITEDIKKVRISTTPGLLRAQKDVKDFNDSYQSGVCPVDLRVYHGEQEIFCEFKALPLSCPSIFRISIPRFYPHSRPIVHCISDTGGSSRFINSQSGLCSHTNLEDGWMATMTLSDVVGTLEQVALDGDGGVSSADTHGLCISPHHSRQLADNHNVHDHHDMGSYQALPPQIGRTLQFPHPQKIYGHSLTADDDMEQMMGRELECDDSSGAMEESLDHL